MIPNRYPAISPVTSPIRKQDQLAEEVRSRMRKAAELSQPGGSMNKRVTWLPASGHPDHSCLSQWDSGTLRPNYARV